VKRKVGVFAHGVLYVCGTEREDRHHWNRRRWAISETMEEAAALELRRTAERGKKKSYGPEEESDFILLNKYFSILNPWMFATRRASMYINGVNRLILIIV
jgi:hypothetical protein